MSLERIFADGPALVPYLVAGDPDAESTKRYVRALVAGGADAIELGLPFSEPIAEGETIQAGIARALDGGMTPSQYLDLAADLSNDPAVDAPLVTMTYYNLIYQYGDRHVESFVAAAAEAGIEGLIVPDLPVDEAEPLVESCRRHGLDTVFIVAPTTTSGRREQILEYCSGYVYVQARLGTTGTRADVSDQTAKSLERVETDLPKAVGFGISDGDQAAEVVAAGADGVIVGSAVVDEIAAQTRQGVDPEVVADRLETFARELKAGARRGRRRASTGSEPT